MALIDFDKNLYTYTIYLDLLDIIVLKKLFDLKDEYFCLSLGKNKKRSIKIK